MRNTALFLIVALSACSGGGSTAPSNPATATPASFSIAYSFVPQGSSSTAAPLVIYDQQFLDPFHDYYLLVTQPVHSDAQWSIDGTSATLLQQQPLGSPAPTASPGTIFVQGGTQYGKATITATSAGITASITAIHYKSLSLGCHFRYSPAFAFDPDRSALMSDPNNWTSADLYVTSPASSLGALDPCLNTQLATGTADAWHVPAGGTLIPVSTLQDFANIGASAWKNDGTTFTPTQTAALVLKTSEGRIVKLMPYIGPYEVSQNGSFVQP